MRINKKRLGITKNVQGISTGLKDWKGRGAAIKITSPVDGKLIGAVNLANKTDYEKVIKVASKAAIEWRQLPAPKRGEIVRQFGDKLRLYKNDLGKLVSYEMGKSLQEGYGEVQEMIDICDFAVGQARQLYGLQMHSERPDHRMFEQWHPLGIVGIISAFNFPVAVWAWNATIAWICGNVCIWKPSEKTPFTAIACQHIFKEVLKENKLPEGISCLLLGDREIGQMMAADKRIPLISATGSTRMGKSVATVVAGRLGKSILELGGNNAIIVTENADLNHAIPAIVFGAVGTGGQRCTTTITGGKILEGAAYKSGCFVEPTIIEATVDMEIVKQETFAPILYLLKYSTLKEAIAIQNSVPQGLSSSIFTLNMRQAEQFLTANGSDCGIANVNIGTSGAEIGGAFGGEKETGGGRESGSDAWKAYMRRQTCTVNYGTELPLAQGIKFDI